MQVECDENIRQVCQFLLLYNFNWFMEMIWLNMFLIFLAKMYIILMQISQDLFCVYRLLDLVMEKYSKTIPLIVFTYKPVKMYKYWPYS